MAKIARVTQLIFAATAVNTGVFGSAQANAGPGTISSSVATIQGLAAWGAGWLSATIGGSKFPCLEEMQGVDFVVTSQLAYLFQQGIPEYDAGTTYYINSVCMSPGTLNIYASLTNANVGNALSNGTNWQLLGNLASLATAVPPVQGEFKNLKITITSGTAGTITADSLILRTVSGMSMQLNTVNNSYATGASGANGLDTGSIASNTWYNEFIIYNPSSSTAASLLSLSATAPTLPSGYTFFARVGAVRYTASALQGKIQWGRKTQNVNVSGLPQMASGTAGNPNTATYVAVAVGAFVPPTASRIFVVSAFNTNAANQGILAPNNNYGAAAGSTSNAPPVAWCGTTAGGSNTAISEMGLETSNIYWASNHTIMSQLYCLGWEDNL